MATYAQRRSEQYARIREHGENLLKIFPDATEQDPVALCKKLRRLEARASSFALRLCNGPEFATEDEADECGNRILEQVKNLLFGMGPENVTVILNRDPRGYALKIDDRWMQAHNPKLHRDWGGYGIIAPEIN